MYVYLPACIDTEAERCLQTPSSIWVISVVLYFPSYNLFWGHFRFLFWSITFFFLFCQSLPLLIPFIWKQFSCQRDASSLLQADPAAQMSTILFGTSIASLEKWFVCCQLQWSHLLHRLQRCVSFPPFDFGPSLAGWPEVSHHLTFPEDPDRFDLPMDLQWIIPMDFLWISALLTSQSSSKVTSLVCCIHCNKGICSWHPSDCSTFLGWIQTWHLGRFRAVGTDGSIWFLCWHVLISPG